VRASLEVTSTAAAATPALGEVRRHAAGLVARQQLRRRAPTGFLLEIEIRKRLPGGVLHDEARIVVLLDGPRRPQGRLMRASPMGQTLRSQSSPTAQFVRC